MVISRGVRPHLCWGWLVLLTLTRTTHAQAVYSQTCCSAKLMDSVGNVLIETENQPPAGSYSAMKISRLCTTDKVTIQVWSKVSADPSDYRYNFKWQQVIRPEPRHLSSTQPMVFRLTSPLTIVAGDRIGIYSGPATTISIPYEFRSANKDYSFHISRMKYVPDYDFNSVTIELDPLMWPRAFAAYIQLCQDDPSGEICATGRVHPIWRGNSNGVAEGPAGPPGPPGPPGGFGGPDDVPIIVECDVPDVTREVANTGNRVADLEQEIIDMRQQLNAIYNSNAVTGICPTGMIGGSYGVGSCYIFRKELATMAVAELSCLRDFDAHLVAIESEIEERFLRTELLRIANPFFVGNPDSEVTESYWTSAMYNKKEGWVWYHEYNLRQPVHQYTNWRGIVPPIPRSGQNVDVCSTFNVNLGSTTSYWEKEKSTDYKFYICELPKRCL